MFDQEIYSLLEHLVNKDKILLTLKGMARGKCPSPDGWAIELFLHFQETMIDEIRKLVEESRRLDKVSGAVNVTLIFLSPKSMDLASFLEFF